MQAAAPLPTRIAEDWFRGLFRRIFFALEGLRPHGRLPPPIAGLVLLRVDRINHLVLRIVALVRQGQYKPRRRTGRPRPAAVRRARPPDPLPRKFGWLAALLPATAAGHRGDLDTLLRQPDMVELIEAAPVTLIPPLRSLCWALQLKPPPILARPKRPASGPEPAPVAAAAAPPATPPFRPEPSSPPPASATPRSDPPQKT
jgi:hypothetical protein